MKMKTLVFAMEVPEYWDSNDIRGEEGEDEYGNASSVTAVLGQGSANQILTSDGTDIAWQDPASSGISTGTAIAMAIVFG